MEFKDAFRYVFVSEEIEDLLKYTHIGDDRLDNTLVKKLKDNKIVKFDGFDERLIHNEGDENRLDRAIVQSELVSGNILIGFLNDQAMVILVTSDPPWLESEEAFWFLENDYKNKSISNVYVLHITFQDQQAEDYQLRWVNIPLLRLVEFKRVFYVCYYSDVHYLQLQSIAIASLPPFYSTFYADCLEYCKIFAKNVIKTIGLHCNGEMVDRINGLAISGTRIEIDYRKPSPSAATVLATNTVHSGFNSVMLFACILGATVGHIIVKLIDTFFFFE